jgi:hypothetical protein
MSFRPAGARGLRRRWIMAIAGAAPPHKAPPASGHLIEGLRRRAMLRSAIDIREKFFDNERGQFSNQNPICLIWSK